ncbi:MAG: hypothetical protein CMH90_06685 [Oceanicaulis sp.]|uniref:hypothetical protein n=1 Tax=Oceanicaulis sp. UBA2681 TaxID=1947007 RepID=UPI000C0909A0|nr:hypothetical protein [Oceanicaulis sp. UBA2681]MAP49149.1 hypothetical protein [Oceanicaulis sp.]VXC56489.1 conserved hypothetical protein [Oceanicaulis sp. 350]
MSIERELEGLARRLSPQGMTARAVMVAPVSASAGASTIAAGLARAAVAQGVKPVWLYDLDFKNNPQSDAFRLNGQAYSGALSGRRFWRTVPDNAGRVALRRVEDQPIYVSRFERAPGQVRSLTFLDNPDYWDRARHSAGLTVVDASYQSAAIALIAPNMDGVILVADARTDSRAATEAAADHLRAQGAQVWGVVVNRARTAARA